MRKLLQLFYLIVPFLLLVSCTKSTEELIPKSIPLISLQNVPVLSQTIDSIRHTITLTVPYRSNLTGLVPLITLSEGASVVPKSGQQQNFSQPVYYTVSYPDGQKIIYTLTVVVASQPIPNIASFSSDTLEAGNILVIKGSHFGDFLLDVQVYLVSKTSSQSLTKRLIDSTQLSVVIPLETLSGSYQLQVKVKNSQSALSVKSLVVTYPTPQILGQSRANVSVGDTLTIIGNFIKPPCEYGLKLSSKDETVQLPSLNLSESQVSFIIPLNLKESSYAIQLQNLTAHKTSAKSSQPLAVYSLQSPFVTGLLSGSKKYKKSDAVVLSTRNLLNKGIRFFQVSLKGSRGQVYVINALFTANTQRLSFSLPDDIEPDTYSFSFDFSDNDTTLYSFSIDVPLTVQ